MNGLLDAVYKCFSLTIPAGTESPHVIYIAGKITGDPDYRQKFINAQSRLEDKGYAVFNPALLPGNLPYDSYHPICCAMIDASDEIHLLLDWSDSPGAKSELLYALEHEKEISTEELC